MKRADRVPPPADDGVQPALAWLRRVRAEEELLDAVTRRLRLRRARRVGVAGAFGILILCGALALRLHRETPAAASLATAIPATVAAPTAIVTRPAVERLPDGSDVELKGDARIAVDFTPEFRRVRLVRGEAHFHVAKDARRPFLVQADGVEVRAVGTAFSVQLAPDVVDVIVTEGTVRVQPETGRPDSKSSEVTAGRRCTIEVAQRVAHVADLGGAEAADRLAWRIPQLEFSRTPLTEVVALMNENTGRASGPRLEIADVRLDEIKLTGFLRADNTTGLLRLLESNFHVSVERTGARILLRQASAARATDDGQASH